LSFTYLRYIPCFHIQITKEGTRKKIEATFREMINKVSRSDGSPTQVLEFLAVTGLPHDEESRRIVRSHAIRDANRRKHAPGGATAPKITEKGPLKPLPQGNFTTKFRLDTKSKRKAAVHKNIGDENKDVDGSIEALAKEIKILNRKSRRSVAAFPGGGRFDPFDSLPVKIGPRQQALIQYRKSKKIYSLCSPGQHGKLTPSQKIQR
jgi:hypothetical protein